MKHLLLLLAIMIPIIGMSQLNINGRSIDDAGLKPDEVIYRGTIKTIFTEWKVYLSDCNELVPDTVRQTGTVKCELIPVKMNGKIVSYNTAPIDTVWNKCDCNDYKYPEFSGLSLSGSIWTNTGSLSVGYVTSEYSLSEPDPAKNTFSIKRNKICMIKKRKASFDDFFERWCVENKLIKTN